ncbi:hypothetical protein AZI87_09230 [Bdellovibrio bacteriovorus]|uniref:Uncharacterized protein n=1 Tax=Bdellovibrio bacteriovorus TaxID=959 RepID=A0A162H0C4_BDEBC|nr:hypothetical protein [Bdellovibrio bacteriovorus]KYG69360.1 hypothetical protein AZI87_09230 [Bdellovibrio bacteriovorus]
MFKSILSSVFLFLLPALSFAASEKIECTAQVFESFPDGTARRESVPLTIETESAYHMALSASLDGRAFVLSGDKSKGPYFVSITEEPDYTKGSLTTAEFSKEGRLQLSVVQGRLTHKLECFKK